MRYILTLLLLSAAMLRTAAQENYTLADTLTLDAVVVTGVTLTSTIALVLILGRQKAFI